MPSLLSLSSFHLLPPSLTLLLSHRPLKASTLCIEICITGIFISLPPPRRSSVCFFSPTHQSFSLSHVHLSSSTSFPSNGHEHLPLHPGGHFFWRLSCCDTLTVFYPRPPSPNFSPSPLPRHGCGMTHITATSLHATAEHTCGAQKVHMLRTPAPSSQGRLADLMVESLDYCTEDRKGEVTEQSQAGEWAEVREGGK